MRFLHSPTITTLHIYIYKHTCVCVCVFFFIFVFIPHVGSATHIFSLPPFPIHQIVSSSTLHALISSLLTFVQQFSLTYHFPNDIPLLYLLDDFVVVCLLLTCFQTISSYSLSPFRLYSFLSLVNILLILSNLVTPHRIHLRILISAAFICIACFLFKARHSTAHT